MARADLETAIEDGRIVVRELLSTGRFNVEPWVAEVEPLLTDDIAETDRRELWAIRAALAEHCAPHVVLDASFRLLSVLEDIGSKYEFEA